MRVAGIQHDVVWEDAGATHARLVDQVAAAAATGARLVVLAEMFATGFSMATDRIAQPPGGPSEQFLSEQATAHGVWLAASISTQPRPDVRAVNRLVVVAPDGRVADHYDKLHPFTYAGEHEHYAGGDRYVTVEVEGVRVTLFVCYDLRFADEFWATAQATDCYLVPANWPDPRRAHWQTLLSARAIENQAYVVGVNRIGEGGGLTYAGDSRIVDPMGEVLAAAAGGESLVVADVDPDRVADVRARLPFLDDRRSA